jgi:pimeloyl-ACP methyl ester carboxylesterase
MDPSDTYHGYERRDWIVDGCPATLVRPHEAAPGRPWIWRAEFLDAFPQVDLALLARGWHLAYLQMGDPWGSPDSLRHWDVFYRVLTEEEGLSPRPALEGLSRGGLYIYNWARDNTDKVCCLYADAPVCDFKSAPGGRRIAELSEGWRNLVEAYHFASDEEAFAYPGNPVDNLAPLAEAHIPLLNIYGDDDDIVPWEENTGVVAERYAALGGEIKLIAKPGVGHHPHGPEDPTEVVEWIEAKFRTGEGA